MRLCRIKGMKKIGLCLVILSFILSGCANLKDPMLPAHTPTETEAEQRFDPSDGDSSFSEKSHLCATEAQMILYSDTVFYQFDDSGIFQLRRTDEKPICILENAHLLGIFDSILYAHTTDHYVAMNLESGENWVQLQPWDNYYGALTASQGKLYCFGHKPDRNGFATDLFMDIVDLNTLSSERMMLEQDVYSAVVYKDNLYYCAHRMIDGTLKAFLIQTDLEMEKEEIIGEIPVNSQMHQAGNHVLIYEQTSDPMIFDLEQKRLSTATTFTNGQNRMQFMNHIAIGTCVYEPERVWLYDISKGKEISLEEFGYERWDFVFDSGVMYGPVDYQKKYVFEIGEVVYEADLSPFSDAGRILDAKGNEQWGLLLTENALFTVDAATGTVQQYKDLE